MDEDRITVRQAAAAWLRLDAALVPLDEDEEPPDAIFDALHVLAEFIYQHDAEENR